MTLKKFFKFVILPLVLIALIVFAIFHKPIIRTLTFDHYFDKMMADWGRYAVLDDIDRILAMGDQAVDPLIEKVQSDQSSVMEKRFALYLLGRLHSEKGLPLILKGLEDKNANIRLGAILGLKYMMKPTYVPNVIPLTKDPSDNIREYAAQALGNADTPESVAALHQMIRKERVLGNWFAAWLALRHLTPVDGTVAEKYRVNKNRQLVPANEPGAEIPYTYFFVKVKEADGEKTINVPFSIWQELKVGSKIRKPAESDDFTIEPPSGSAS